MDRREAYSVARNRGYNSLRMDVEFTEEDEKKWDEAVALLGEDEADRVYQSGEWDAVADRDAELED